jgi:hypothetical protein
MTTDLIAQLQSMGLTLRPSGDTVKISGKKSLLTAILVDELRAQKSSISHHCALSVEMVRSVVISRNLNELESRLKDFSRHSWTLCDRANMSNAYTPVALKLISEEQADKFATLENLANLCWCRSTEISS